MPIHSPPGHRSRLTESVSHVATVDIMDDHTRNGEVSSCGFLSSELMASWASKGEDTILIDVIEEFPNIVFPFPDSRIQGTDQTASNVPDELRHVICIVIMKYCMDLRLVISL